MIIRGCFYKSGRGLNSCYAVPMQKTFPIKVEKIAHDGAAEATHEGKPVRIHGMLPEEEGVVEAHSKHGIFIGTLKELTVASPSRKMPEELHYLSCSPWQVMEYPLQAALKADMLTELFGYYDREVKVGFTPTEKFFGYRTKVEFSFLDREGDLTVPLSLAFHVRGGGNARLPLPEGCALASEPMDRAALMITERLRDLGYVSRDLKTLIIRESKTDGKLIAILYAKCLEVTKFPVSDIPNLAGLIVFHSTEKSPASVPTKELWRVGDDSLIETIADVSLRYSWDSFFQNNIPVFAAAVEMMRLHVQKDARVLELYSGVGSIGLLLAKEAKEVRGVEIVPAAVEAANQNAYDNGITNYHAECLPAEKMDGELLSGADVLVLDPPRVGLHPKLIAHIREKLPPKIVYLSCNPETQARDHSALADLYQIDLIHGFDFYPNTPHSESLLVLSLRNK